MTADSSSAGLTLLYSQSSPYVRKVLMLAHETGQADSLQLLPTDVWAPDSPISRRNPLAKIPCLVLADGSTLFDSPVICEFLDSQHQGRPLFPAAGPARWAALRQQALGDGICDASVLRRLERLRPESLRSADWDKRQRMAVLRSLDLLEASVAEIDSPDAPSIGGLAVAAALGYLDFRFPDEPWRPGRPRLAHWFDAMAHRDSFRRTAPPLE